MAPSAPPCGISKSGGEGRMGIFRRIMFVPIVLAVSGCGYLGVTPGAGGAGSGLALPWDTSTSPSHEIFCAYDSEGITSAGTAGPTSGCSHHANGSSTSTQDGDAIDFDLHTGNSVLSVDNGIVRWAGAYSVRAAGPAMESRSRSTRCCPMVQLRRPCMPTSTQSTCRQVNRSPRDRRSQALVRLGEARTARARAPMAPICISRSIRMRTTPR